jgi:hypothetical protein
MDFENLKINKDTLTSQIISTNLQERCGLKINQLQAKVSINNKSIKLDNLLLKTNNSTISNYYEMKFNRFLDFSHYLDRVNMVANFDKTFISMNDIAYFAPAVKKLTVKEVDITKGVFNGTVNNFIASNINIKTGNTFLDGTLSMKGLPIIQNTYIVLNANNLSTTGNEITRLVPAANVPTVAWNALTDIKYKGNYTGYIQNFDIDGVLSTNLGTVNNKLNLNFPKNNTPSYKGYFNTTDLQLGKIIKQKVIGNISASGNIDGKGFNLNDLDTKFDGEVKYIQTPTYTFQNLIINGKMANKTFDGKINTTDPNLTMNFDGVLNLNSTQPEFVLKTDLVQIDLKKLGITKEQINGKAKLDLNFKGKTLDEFTGRVSLRNLSLFNNNKHVYLDSAILTSIPSGNNKTISLKSSAADALLTGDFSIKELPKALMYYLNFYLPNYISKPKNVLPQAFTFDLKTKEIGDIINTFLPFWQGGDNASFSGELNMNSQLLKLSGNVPLFKIKDYSINNLALNSNGNFNNFTLNGTTENIFVGNNKIVPNSIFNSKIYNDTADITINTSGGTYQVKDATIQAKGFAKSNIFYINILPSSFYLNEGKWNISTTNYVVIDKTNIAINTINIENGLQQIVLNTQGNKNENLVAKVTNLDIEEISKFAPNELNLHGRVNGTINVNEYLGQQVLSGNINTTTIRFKQDTLGSLLAEVDYDKANKVISIKSNSGLIYNGDKTQVYGTINLAEKDPVLNLHANLNNTQLKTFENFFTKFITNTSGLANGFVNVEGPLGNYKVNGKIDISNFSSKVIYLGTSYTIPKGSITLNESVIDLGKMTMKDIEGNNAILTGKIFHNRFKNLQFGKTFGETNPLTIRSDKFIFLNTTNADNNLYYGKVIANGTMYLSGPIENMYMEIIATTLSNTDLTLPLRDGYDANDYSFIHFNEYGTDTVAQTKNFKEKNRLKISLFIEATPQAQMHILMDPANGEEIVGRGNGSINMEIDLDNDLKMTGDYTITEGSYGFRFMNVIRKDLTIVPGGTITWTGKPLEANLDIVAAYNVKTNLLPLIGSDLNNASAADKTSYDTKVLINLTGQMLSPVIKYDISQIGNNDINSIGYAKLLELKNDDQKMLTQVASLISTNQFLNTDATNNNNVNTAALISNTISSAVTPTLSNIITQQVNKLVRTKNLQISISHNTDEGSNGTRDFFNLKVRQSFLNDRIQFEIGDDIEYTRGSSTANYTALPNDFKFKYLITPNGQLSLSLFRTTFTDFSSTERIPKIGMGLNFEKSINNINEVWKKEPKPNYPILFNDSLNTKGTN